MTTTCSHLLQTLKTELVQKRRSSVSWSQERGPWETFGRDYRSLLVHSRAMADGLTALCYPRCTQRRAPICDRSSSGTCTHTNAHKRPLFKLIRTFRDMYLDEGGFSVVLSEANDIVRLRISLTRLPSGGKIRTSSIPHRHLRFSSHKPSVLLLVCRGRLSFSWFSFFLVFFDYIAAS